MYSENEESTLSFTRPDIVKDLGSVKIVMRHFEMPHILLYRPLSSLKTLET